MDNELLRPITRAWMGKLRKAADHKKVEFQDDADEAMRFFDGPHDFMYHGKYAGNADLEEGGPTPTFRMTVNKVAEVVQLYGPYLYHRNPHRSVSPRHLPPVPPELLLGPLAQQLPPEALQQVQQQFQQQELGQRQQLEVVSDLLASMLNFTPNELDLRGHSRMMVDEAVIKGMGLLWTEVFRPPGARQNLIGSFHDSVDNLLIDPDVEHLLHAKYISRRRVMPVWEVEDRYGIPRGTLRGNLQSDNVQGEVLADAEYRYFQARGDTNDLFVFFEVYSRMGVGHLLKDCANVEANKELLDRFGKHVYLAVCDEYSWPLNLPEDVFKRASQEEAFLRLQWPIPFWADPTCPWPFSYTAFHQRPRKIWPMSHVKPGLGELRFINWAISFLADKIKNTSRDFIAILKSAGEDLRTAVLSGKDLTLLEFEKVQGSIRDVVQILQFQPVNPDIWKIIDAMFTLLDKRLGTNEMMYGATHRQLRSAQESSDKRDFVNIRPDDMAEQVEAAMTMVARKEAIASRWLLTGQDVAPILGPERAQLWDQVVRSTDIQLVVTELEYRIEAGSVRKPNKNRDMDNANASVQVWAPFFQNYAMTTGDFQAVNSLLEMWAKANDIEPEKMLLQPPQPQPDAQQQQAQQQMQAELEMKQTAHQQQLQQSQEKHQLQLQQLQEKQQTQLQVQQLETRQELTQDQQQHEQELAQDRENHLLQLLQARQMGQVQARVASAKGAAAKPGA